MTKADRALDSFVVRFDGHNDGVPHEIIALERSGDIKVRLHVAMNDRVAFPDAETIGWAFYYEPYAFSNTAVPSWLVERIEPHLPEFLVHQARVRIDRTQASFRLLADDIHSDRNLFYRLAGWLYEKLSRHSIELVLFDEVPHYGFAYLIYVVARAMEIRTVMFLQFLHTTRTLVAERIEDLGRLLERPPIAGPIEEPVERGFRKTLHVAIHREHDGVAEQLTSMGRRQVNHRTLVWLPAVWSKLVFDLLRTRLLGMQVRTRGAGLHRALHDSFMGPELRKLRAAQTLDARARFEIVAPDLECDFVLFALHMQPEATTHPLGGAYGDQARAIEKLRSMIPNGWKIYVKEHHAGFGGLRDPHFYMRLQSMPEVVLVSAATAIAPLLEGCRFAATITGTIGWEAISGGKPVLTFGHAWYNGLPGVFRIEDEPSCREIATCRIDHAELTVRFRELSTRFGGFTPAWGLAVNQLPAQFERNENCRRFVSGMRTLLAATPVRDEDRDAWSSAPSPCRS